MALTRPILLSVSAFDAANPQVFTFVVNSGDQVVANRLTIKLQNEQQTVIYDQKTTTFTLEHILPADTLTNGSYYQATVTTYNADGNESDESAPIQFYCYTTPIFEFNNLPESNLIANSSFNFGVTYDQEEDEMLDSYVFVLYDAQGVQISTSGTQYVGSVESLPIDISHTFSGLTDNTTYYIQTQGVTTGGTAIKTIRERILVQYVQPTVFSVLALSNNCQGGYITLSSTFIDIEGTSNPSPPIYIDDDTAVDARTSGRYVAFDEGYSIDGDFTASLWGRDFQLNQPIITLSSVDTSSAVVSYRQDFDDASKVYADCVVTSAGVRYYIYTPSIAKPSSTDKVQIWLRRVGNLYTLELHNLGGGS